MITGVARRRYWPAHEKLRIIEESLVPGESVSAVARRNGVAPNLLFRWRRLMDEGGAMAVGSNEPVVGASEVRKLEDRVRDLERLLGRKTMENVSTAETRLAPALSPGTVCVGDLIHWTKSFSSSLRDNLSTHMSPKAAGILNAHGCWFRSRGKASTGRLSIPQTCRPTRPT